MLMSCFKSINPSGWPQIRGTDDTTQNTPPARYLKNSTGFLFLNNSQHYNYRNQGWQTHVCLGLIMYFDCMYLHLPLICLLRPLSVPRTLPHPLQIRFQRRHTPRGEKPREQWGFREETRRDADDTALWLLESWAVPQHLSSTIWYRSTKTSLDL